MFSITFKRSAATLGVVAGLLAAAGPASAQLPPTTNGAPASSGWPGGLSDALAKDLFDGGGLTAKEPAMLAVLDTGMFEHEWLSARSDAGYTPPVGSNKGSLTAPPGSP